MRAMAAASRLCGVAMFEFKVDDCVGSVALLEVNTRFWGSLPQRHGGGVDFPWLWIFIEASAHSQPNPSYSAHRTTLVVTCYRPLLHIPPRTSASSCFQCTEGDSPRRSKPDTGTSCSLGRLPLGQRMP